MFLVTNSRLLFVAVASLLLLLPLVAVEANEVEEDQPVVDFNALFLAYIRLGDALFGTWSPRGIEQKLLNVREYED